MGADHQIHYTMLIFQVKGSEVFTYGGSPVAYALSPTETVRVVRVFLMNCIWLCSTSLQFESMITGAQTNLA